MATLAITDRVTHLGDTEFLEQPVEDTMETIPEETMVAIIIPTRTTAVTLEGMVVPTVEAEEEVSILLTHSPEEWHQEEVAVPVEEAEEVVSTLSVHLE